MSRIPPGTETVGEARGRRAHNAELPGKDPDGPHRLDEALILAREKVLEARRLLRGPFSDRHHGGVPIYEELFDLQRGLIDPLLVFLSRLWTIRTGRIWRSTSFKDPAAAAADEVRGFRRG